MEDNTLQLFEGKHIRTQWDAEKEKWFFSIVDIVEVLTESKDYQTARKYWNKLKQRLKEEGNESVTHCHQLKLPAADGKSYKTDVADQAGMFRLIQSIPSPKAEPIKRWIAQVASDRIDEMQDPELAIERGYEYYRRKGYGEKWIEQRMKGKATRKELTDELQRCGVKDNQFATLESIYSIFLTTTTLQAETAQETAEQENPLLRTFVKLGKACLGVLTVLSLTGIYLLPKPDYRRAWWRARWSMRRCSSAAVSTIWCSP